MIDTLALILAVAGLCVDDRVRHPPVTLPDELEFSRAIFNGKDTLAVRDGGEEPARHGGLAGGSCSRHADRHAIAQACGQKVQHFLCGCAALHEVRLAEIPGIHDTDGCGNTGILIQHRRFDDRDTNVLCQSGGNDGAGIVQYLAGVLQHTADDIGGVFRRIEMLLQLGGMTVRILDLNVPPGVDVDLLDAVREDVLGQKSVLCHFRVQSVHQFRGRHAIHSNAVLLQIPCHAALHLLFGTRIILCDEGGVGFREIALHLTERLRKGDAFLLRGKEEFACTWCSCSFREK